MSLWSVWWEFFVAKTVDGNDFILNACGISNIAMGDKICIDMYFVVSTVKLLKFIMSSPWVFAKSCPGHIYTLNAHSWSCHLVPEQHGTTVGLHTLCDLSTLSCLSPAPGEPTGLSGKNMWMVVDFVGGGYCRSEEWRLRLQINSHAMAMPVGSQWSSVAGWGTCFAFCQAQGQAQSRKCTREESDESCLFSSWVSVSSKVWCKMWVYVGGIVFLLRMDLYHSNIVYIIIYMCMYIVIYAWYCRAQYLLLIVNYSATYSAKAANTNSKDSTVMRTLGLLQVMGDCGCKEFGILDFHCISLGELQVA